MKALIIQVCHIPQGGGAEFIANKLSKIASNKNFTNKGIFFNNANKVKLENNQIILGNQNSYNILNFFKLFLTIIKLSNQYPKVVLHGHLTHALYFLIPFSYFKKFILIYTEHNSKNKRRDYYFFKPIEKFVYSRYKRIISVSPFVQKQLLSWLEIDLKINNKKNKKFKVIYNGSSQNEFISRDFAKKKFNLISIGSLTKQKGFDLSIKAISHCREIINSYTILGEGPERKLLEEIISRRNLYTLVKMPGYVSSIHKYLENTDLALIPSLWEGHPLVSIEMISSGLPLCISNVGGLADILSELKTVKVIKNFDEKKWGAEIRESLESLDILKSDLKKSSTFVSKFSLENMINNYKTEYLNLLRSN